MDRAYDRAYRQLANKVRIPGFRPGKVPRPVLEGHLGRDAVRQEALDLLINESYLQALEKEDIEPIEHPKVDVGQLQPGAPLTYAATVTVKPEVELGTYRGLAVKVEPEAVTPADVEREFNSLREKLAELEPVESDTVLSEGLFVIMDLEGTVDGGPFPGGNREGAMAQFGAGQLEPEFETALRDARAGETRECSLVFGADHPNPELAGKTAQFKIKVKEMKRKILPDLNDEFCREIAGTDLAGLRERITKSLEEGARRNAREEATRQVLEKVVAHSSVDLPELMVDQQVERKKWDTGERLSKQGLTIEQYLEMVGLDQEAWDKDLRARAEHEVRRDLVLEALAKKEGLIATDAEIEFEIASLAARRGENAEKLRKLFHESPGRREALGDGIVARKTVHFLVQENVVETPPSGEPEAASEDESRAEIEAESKTETEDGRGEGPA